MSAISRSLTGNSLASTTTRYSVATDHLTLHLQHSKTDQLGKGYTLDIGSTPNDLCSVSTFGSYVSQDLQPWTEAPDYIPFPLTLLFYMRLFLTKAGYPGLQHTQPTHRCSHLCSSGWPTLSHYQTPWPLAQYLLLYLSPASCHYYQVFTVHKLSLFTTHPPNLILNHYFPLVVGGTLAAVLQQVKHRGPAFSTCEGGSCHGGLLFLPVGLNCQLI